MYDFKPGEEEKQRKSFEFYDSRKMFQGIVWEYSLMQNGYFTLGTNKGNSEHSIDDGCDISFGHPYSMTSFPYPVIDGKKYIPAGFTSNQDVTVHRSYDTLALEQAYEKNITTKFLMSLTENGDLKIVYHIVNQDAVNHSIGMGLLFDAALGKWGDGYVLTNNEVLDKVTPLSGEDFSSLVLMERKTSPLGLRVNISYGHLPPDEIVVSNWHDEYSGKVATGSLYDLALHTHWNEVEVLPGDTASFVVNFTLLPPDINDQIFIRWDMPNILSIENQMLFPSELLCNTEIINNSTSGKEVALRIPETDYIYGWESEAAFVLASPNEVYYQQVKVRIPETYDSVTTCLKLELIENGNTVDELSRCVFIPAAPFTNEGLNVVIDTTYLTGEKLYLSFYNEIEATGQLLNNLHRNNVFLFQNDIPLEDFVLEKDTSGGTNKADIIFVLDVTGSMSEEIKGVRDNINEFADSLFANGTDFRLGLLTFLDIIEKKYDFTNDVQQFQLYVSEQYAHGGGDRPENSLDALSAATQYDFRSDANRIIIWITDADYHINNHITQLTKESVINQLLAAGIQVHCIGDPVFQTNYYDQIILNTGGSFFNIYGNFRDIMLEVSRLNQATNYLLSVNPPDGIRAGDEFKIEVHYAGLGGMDSIYFEPGKKNAGIKAGSTEVVVFPNPFHFDSNIKITGSENCSYTIEIFNMQGQLMKSSPIYGISQTVQVYLSDLISPAEFISNQIYLIKASIISENGKLLDQHTIKVKKL